MTSESDDSKTSESDESKVSESKTSEFVIQDGFRRAPRVLIGQGRFSERRAQNLFISK